MNESYCAQLNSDQVRDVLRTERSRMKRHPKHSSTWNSAFDLVRDAKYILAKRGEWVEEEF